MFSFAPIVFIILGCLQKLTSYTQYIPYLSAIPNSNSTTAQNFVINSNILTTEFGEVRSNTGFRLSASSYYSLAKKSTDGKTIIWYHSYAAGDQMNSSSLTYYWLAMG